MRGKYLKFGWPLKIVFSVLTFVVVCIGLFSLSVPKASASFLERIPFSATMLDSAGANIADGDYQVVFRFYAVSTGGSVLWEETQTVTTEKGKFETLLGSLTALSSLNLDQTLYIAIQVGADSEMTPRKQVGATPQALIAKKATSLVAPTGGLIEALGGLHISEGLSIDGNATFSGKLVFSNGSEIAQSGSVLTLSSSILPTTSGLDLGSAAKYWANLFASTIDLKEGTIPSYAAGYGKLYTASDSTLHFLSSANVDSKITTSTGSGLNAQELVKEFTADSGESISAGNLVSYINGKVRKGALQTIGTASVIPSSKPGIGAAAPQATANISAVALSTNKIAISYSDLGNSNYGTTIVGTISGDTVTWGDPSIFTSTSTYNAPGTTPIVNISAVALASDKIAVSYTDLGNSNYGTTIVGSISGTTITWGTASVFAAASTNYISAAPLSGDKIAISYSDVGTGNQGTAIIGSITGTTLLWGTASVLSATVSTDISTVALTSNKIAVSYSDATVGTTKIGTIDGIALSWGSSVIFPAAGAITSTASNIASTALSTDKIAIAYSDMGHSAFGTAVIGTVSGTVVSFGAASIFELSPTFDALHDVDHPFFPVISVIAQTSDKIIVSYQDGGSSRHGTTIVGSISGSALTWGKKVSFKEDIAQFVSTVVLSGDKIGFAYQDFIGSRYANFVMGTSQPYIGVSSSACTGGQTCSVSIKGIVSGLSSLTAGAIYYAGADGVLTTTPYPNRVGIAVSATEIILDGKWDSGDMMVSDLVFKNSFHMTEYQNSSGQQGLVMYDQNTKPILSLTDSGGLTVSGDVGIGTSSPTAKLHVIGSAGKVGIELSSNETTAASNILMLRSDVGTDDNSIFRVQADGKVYADGAYTGTGADYAEYFANEEVIPATTLVGLDKASGKARKYQAGDKLIGVVSSNAGFIGNSTTEIENDPNYTLVGLMGQVNIDPSGVNIVDGTVYTLDGIQLGQNLLGGKVLIDIVMPDTRINKVLLSFDKDGALLLGAGSRLYSKSAGLLALEGSLEIMKDLYVRGKIITPSSETQYLTADSIIDPNAGKIKIAGKEGAIILTSEQIIAGEDGQNLIIQGVDDTNTVTVSSLTILPTSRIKLGADSRVLGKGDILTLTYDAQDAIWYEVGFTDN